MTKKQLLYQFLEKELRNAGLTYFVKTAMREEFPSWVIDNGLDITTPISQPAFLYVSGAFLNVEGTFW